MADEPQTPSEVPTSEGTLLSQEPVAEPQVDEQPAAQDAVDEAADTEKDEAASTDEGEAEDDSEAEAEGAPEEYADFTAPEGVELDGEALAAFKEVAKGDNLSQEKAQRYVDAAVELIAKRDKAQADAILAVRGEWKTASEADPEIGGDKLASTVADAKRGLEAFGTPALAKFVDETGIGNHPEIIRFFAKAGATVAEDKIVTGAKPTSEPATMAERLYPSKND